MAEQLHCSFCSHVGNTKVENNLKTVTYPKIKKKVKGNRFEGAQFDHERERQVFKNVRFLRDFLLKLLLLDVAILRANTIVFVWSQLDGGKVEQKNIFSGKLR